MVRELAQRRLSKVERETVEAAAKEATAETETHGTATGQAEEKPTVAEDRSSPGGAAEERSGAAESKGSASSPPAASGQGSSNVRLAPLGAATKTTTTKKATKTSKIQPEIEMARGSSAVEEKVLKLDASRRPGFAFLDNLKISTVTPGGQVRASGLDPAELISSTLILLPVSHPLALPMTPAGGGGRAEGGLADIGSRWEAGD